MNPRTLMLPGVLALALLAGACAPQKPLTPEQQLLQEAQNDCSAAATSMNDAPYNSSNPFWNSYFVMCMQTKYGVTDAQLKTLWY